MIPQQTLLSSKKLLESRAQIHKLQAGLSSVRGAQDIITLICQRRTVTKLVLGHNFLGNDGTIALFRFLESELGRKHPIAEISLNSNQIGNEGWLAVTRYLKGNRELKELFLQANELSGDPAVTKTFVEALNSSHLEVLSLTTNHGLGDIFLEDFMALLNAPHLRELHVSSIRLTPRSAPYIADFIRSPHRCRLETLRCNGNSLGLRGVKAIIKATEQSNYSLVSAEFHANQVSDQDISDDEDVPPTGWNSCQSDLMRVRLRNEHLRRATQRQALELLRYSRALLLRGCSRAQDTATATAGGGFPFAQLPIELQLSILSLLAPSLSPTQRTRVFNYASETATLPPLLPSLRRHAACLPDPVGHPGAFGGGPGTVWPTNGGKDVHCSGGQCMGTTNTVSCNKDKERKRWLEEVGCNIYEPGIEGCEF